MNPLYFNLIKVPSNATKSFFKSVSSPNYLLDSGDSVTTDLSILIDWQVENVEQEYRKYTEKKFEERPPIPITQLNKYFYLSDKKRKRITSGHFSSSSSQSIENDVFSSSDQSSFRKEISISKNSVKRKSFAIAQMIQDEDVIEEKDFSVENTKIKFQLELDFDELVVPRSQLLRQKQQIENEQNGGDFLEANFEQLLEYFRQIDEQSECTKKRPDRFRILFDQRNLLLDSKLCKKLSKLLDLDLIDIKYFTKYELLERMETIRLLQVQFS